MAHERLRAILAAGDSGASNTAIVAALRELHDAIASDMRLAAVAELVREAMRMREDATAAHHVLRAVSHVTTPCFDGSPAARALSTRLREASVACSASVGGASSTTVAVPLALPPLGCPNLTRETSYTGLDG